MARIQIYLTQWCPYCRMARRLLEERGLDWDEIDVEAEPERRDEMVRRSGRRTVPQIWIDARHVGGYDDLAALHASGELDAWLAGAGTKESQSA